MNNEYIFNIFLKKICRSYYRCTNSKCTVKKRVERSSNDPSVVITTYEGSTATTPSPSRGPTSTPPSPPAT